MKPKPWTWLWALVCVTLGVLAGRLLFMGGWFTVVGAAMGIVMVFGAIHERVDHWYDDES
jgi:hypothetical protein